MLGVVYCLLSINILNAFSHMSLLPFKFENESLSMKLEEQMSENTDLTNKYVMCIFSVCLCVFIAVIYIFQCVYITMFISFKPLDVLAIVFTIRSTLCYSCNMLEYTCLTVLN